MTSEKRAAVYDKMLEMLDRIHQRIDMREIVVRPGPEDPDIDIDDLFNEIGCLIAEAKGEYDPDAPVPGSIDHMPEQNGDAVDENGCPTW